MKISKPGIVVPESELENMTPRDVRRHIAAQEGRELEETKEERELTIAEARLKKLKEGAPPEFVPAGIEGENILIKRLSFRELTELTEILVRDARNALTFDQSDQSSRSLSVSKAVLQKCVFNPDQTPYFTVPVLHEYLESPEATALVGTLVMRVFDVNPDIMNTVKKT